ncbi:MAG: hypothetical protein KBS75_07180 [Bacteroidales bacterium]|nr:hypothetical protein [Candidatus Equimonas faecalis]
MIELVENKNVALARLSATAQTYEILSKKWIKREGLRGIEENEPDFIFAEKELYGPREVENVTEGRIRIIWKYNADKNIY